MRINVYSQELTSEVIAIFKESNGREVTGVPCYPNGQPSGKPRERLPGFLREIWEKSVMEVPIGYHAAQLVLHSSPHLHHPPMDDDRSAITFWIPKSESRREMMAKAFEKIAECFRTAPPDSGMD